MIAFKNAKNREDVKKTYNDIIKNGLLINDNGEANGIWFSNGHLFYSNHPNYMIVSIPKDEEIAKKIGISQYDFENNSSIMVAHSDVPAELLTVEQEPREIEVERFKKRIKITEAQFYELFTL